MGTIGYLSGRTWVRSVTEMGIDARLVKTLFLRRELREELKLPDRPKKQRVTSGYTSWNEIFSLLKQRNPDSAVRLKKDRETLKKGKIKLNAPIPIREKKATVNNVPEILQRRALRAALGLPVSPMGAQNTVRWLDVFKKAVSIKAIPKAERLIAQDCVDYFEMRGDEYSVGDKKAIVDLFQARFAGDLVSYGRFLRRLIDRVDPPLKHLEMDRFFRHLEPLLEPKQIGQAVWAAVEDLPNRGWLVVTIGALLYSFRKPPKRVYARDRENAALFSAFLGPALAATHQKKE